MLQTTTSSTSQAGFPAIATLGALAERSDEATMLLARARNAAYAEAAQGRLGQGLTLLHEALQHEPMSHDLMSDMAALLLAAGEFQHAAAYAQRALDISPEHGASLYSLAFALAGRGETGGAIEALRCLTQGEAQASLMREAPDLMPLVYVELARLQAAV